MLRIKYPFMLFLLSAGMAGCSGGSPDGTTQQAGDFFMSVQTTPNPPEVGSNAEVVATVKMGNQPNSDCKVGFRQFMPSMEMSNDNTVYSMVQQGTSGVYQARGGEFSMGGEWVLEFTLECNGKTQTVKFPYNLKWPE
jgi:hypothetical protein